MMPGLPILTYHDFDQTETVLATDPARFADQMAELDAAGFRTLDLGDWVAAGFPAHDRSFALTFDDGYRAITQVASILARYNFRATAFLVSGRMGDDNQWPGQPAWVSPRPLLGWADLAELQAAGVSFASHTRTHPDLRRLDDARLLDELRGSRQDIEDRIGESCPLLAYPYGSVDQRVRRAASRVYSAAFGTRLGYTKSIGDRFLFSRIDAYYLRSRGALRRLIEGRMEARFRWRRVARRARGLLAMTTATIDPEPACERSEQASG